MAIAPLVIDGNDVEIEDCFKFLGIHLTNDLNWNSNVMHCIKKAQKCIFYLRRLRSFHLSSDLLVKFYRAVIESVLTQSITVWYGSTTAADRRALERVVKLAARIIGRDLTPISEIYRSRVENKACAIINDEFHPANELFELLRSGKRYRVIKCNTERFRRSFYPTAVRELNDMK